MKRSEMVDKIQLKLEEQSHYGTSYRIKADIILELIEKAEMLPPLIGGKVKVETTENGEIIIPIWGWENEDEKN
jgi:hypothetical protein